MDLVGLVDLVDLVDLVVLVGLVGHNVRMSPIGMILLILDALASGIRTSQTEPLAKSGAPDQHTKEKPRMKHVVSVRLKSDDSSRCERLGEAYKNFGKTAREACCA